ncbi:SSU ribosomal protein S5p (S2e) [Rubrivivax sp. A210]|uniref:DUF1840 domain-containing protein n=1 Tax=Rubrivivax sp. A210 TaxID=2772301 RepID=UPI001918D733|nr:DUF1840 domain-containing protein [Rubrivivax sp. A210]CAD5371828.1 SSU ribosomal protein S5p (S2e) [Rubrivivax sp. A210]
MIYKFKSAAAGDVIMLRPQGEQMLRLLGREPSTKGIIEPQAMGEAIALLQQAIADEAAAPEVDEDGEPRRPAVSLRQRLWPMVEMLRRCQAADKPVVWGV